MSYTEKRNQVDLLQQKINAYEELSADVKKKINYKFRLDWNYYSNSMEGNTLTMEETRSVMVGNLTVGGKPIKDVLEMKGHDEVIKDVLRIGKGEARISEARIRDIHKGIMHEEDEAKKKKIGVWKTEPNYIYNYKNERFDFALPADVPARMHELLNKTNSAIDAITANKKDSPHPLDVALQFHLDYVIIHPFYDGNGRTARILTNLLLISFGYPPFWVKTNERIIYNQYIGDIQGYGGNPDLFFEFSSTLILRSQQLVLDAIAGKEIEEHDDIDKRVALLDRMMDGMDEAIQKTKTEEVMQQIFTEVVEPLFRKVFEKVLKISQLFSDTEFTFYIDGGGGVHGNINDLIDDVEISWHNKKGNIGNINLQIRLSKLKKLGTKAFDMNDDFKINFEKHKYQIVLQQNEHIDRLYHQMLSSQKVDEIAAKFVNTIITRIEEQVKAINGN